MKYKKPSQRRLKRTAKKTINSIVPFITIFGLLTAFYVMGWKVGYFDISNVEVIGAKTYVNETDVKELVRARVYGKKIFSIDANELENLLLSTFQGSRFLKVTKSLPDTLKIHITERSPLAVIRTTKDAQNLYLVDEQGYVLGIVEEGTTNLPRILCDDDVSVGIFLDKNLLPVYFEVITSLDNNQVPASSVSATDRYMRVFVKDGVEVLVGFERDIAETVELLAKLLKQLSIEGKNARKVDLRYDKVIVSYD